MWVYELPHCLERMKLAKEGKCHIKYTLKRQDLTEITGHVIWRNTDVLWTSE